MADQSTEVLNKLTIELEKFKQEHPQEYLALIKKLNEGFGGIISESK